MLRMISLVKFCHNINNNIVQMSTEETLLGSSEAMLDILSRVLYAVHIQV